MLDAGGGDRLVGLPAQVEHHVLAGRRLEQVEREVGRQDAAHAVALADLGERDLAVDDDFGAALHGGDDHVHALGGAIEGRAVSEVALDEFGRTRQRRVERVAIADQQAQARLGLVQQVAGDMAAEHAGRAGQENGLGHRAGPSNAVCLIWPFPSKRLAAESWTARSHGGTLGGMFDLIDLRAFARIADLGSLSAAARALGMPKSSASRSLARLEAAAGAALIERSTRHLRLTDAGHLLQRHARRILDDVAEAENALTGLVGMPRGTLRVSVGFTFAAGPLASMLPKFLARYPEVRVALSIENRNVDLLAEEFDVAVRIGPLRDSELIARRLTAIALWTCASPAYLAARGTPMTVDDLRAHELIARVDRRTAWRFQRPGGAVDAIDVVPGTVIPEPAVLKTVLIGGAGIGRLPEFHAADAVVDGTLVRLLPEYQQDCVEVHALYSSHRSLSAKVRVFIDALAEHLTRAI